MIRVKVYKESEVDNYETGCSMMGGTDFGCIETREFATPGLALKFCQAFGEPYIFDNRLEVQRQENADGDEPSSKEMLDFKESKIFLYVAHYSFYLSKVERTDLENSDLVSIFPSLEQS